MELRVGQAADKGRGNKVPEAESIPPERRRTGGLAPSWPPAAAQDRPTPKPGNSETDPKESMAHSFCHLAGLRWCGGAESVSFLGQGPWRVPRRRKDPGHSRPRSNPRDSPGRGSEFLLELCHGASPLLPGPGPHLGDLRDRTPLHSDPGTEFRTPNSPRLRIGHGRALGRCGHRCTEPRLPPKGGAILVGGCLPFFEESLFPRGCPGRTMAISTRGGSAVPAEAVSPIVDTPLSCGWRGPNGRGQCTGRPFAGGARVSWPTVRSGSSVTPKVSEFFFRVLTATPHYLSIRILCTGQRERQSY